MGHVASIILIVQRLAVWLLVSTMFTSCSHLAFTEASGSGSESSTASAIVSATKDVMDGTERIGRIRYHYDSNPILGRTTDDDSRENLEGNSWDPSQQPCSDVVIVGVGTGMSVEDYNKLAERIVNATRKQSFLFIVSDHNPNRLTKLSPNQYAGLANAIRNQMHSGLIPICSSYLAENTNHSSNYSSSTITANGNKQRLLPAIARQQHRVLQDRRPTMTNFFIGGHSASGQAALEAVQKEMYDFVPRGFVGLDPYDISEKTMDYDIPLSFPTLDWGFTNTTCFVQVNKAALGAYRLSSADNGRVLYLIDNDQKNDMTHCIFTDNGCGVAFVNVCPTEKIFEWVLDSVAESLATFVNALKTELGIPFDKENFELPATASGAVFLYVNNDVVSFDENGDSGNSTKISMDSSIDNENVSGGAVVLADTATESAEATDRDSGSNFERYCAHAFYNTVVFVGLGWVVFHY